MNLKELLKEINIAFESDNVPMLKTLTKDHFELAKDNALEVLPLITGNIQGKLIENNANLYYLYCELFDELSEQCNSDDVVLILHKEITETHDRVKFSYLLHPLKRALLKLPMVKIKYFIWCFNAIQTFMTDIEVPSEANMEFAEGATEVPHDTIGELNILYNNIGDFYKEITTYMSNCKELPIALNYVMNLLGNPIVNVSASSINLLRNPLQNIVSIIITHEDPFKYLDHNYLSQVEDIQINNVAIAHFYYLLFVEHLSLDRTPKVYSTYYLFQGLLKFVTVMLKLDEQYSIEKCLLLANTIMNSKNLPYALLDDPIHSRFSLNLSNIIIYNTEKQNRLKALETFKKYILSFDNKGRTLLITNIFHQCNHSGLMGYLITLYKDMLVDQFKCESTFESQFRGPQFTCIISQFCYLPAWKLDSLVEHADHIVAALNLLIYVIKRDKTTNITGIGSLVSGINTFLIEPLQKSLEKSREECDLRIKELEEKIAQGDLNEANSNVSVMVCGRDLPDVTIVEKLNILRASMTALNLVECVLSRLLELIV